MRALVVERSLARFAAARVSSRLAPLRLDATMEEPALPGPGWHRVRPRLAGICGSDLATVDGKSSRWFEPIVSFPFVPGHEVVGTLDDGRRVVVEPVLKCATRAVRPACDMCAAGRTNLCERVAFGDLEPGLQTGYCTDTGGGWSEAMVAHDSQLHLVPEDMSDEAAVMVEPAACATHAAAQGPPAQITAVIGAGTLGLLTVAALRRSATPPGHLVAAAKHPHQRRLVAELGADEVCRPEELERVLRRATRSLAAGRQLTGGVATVFDCVGSAASLAQALRVAAPGGTIVMVGMPGPTLVDLTPLWQREVNLRGAYAYTRADFEAAFGLVAAADLGRLVSARYPLERFHHALDHAAAAGRRDSVKVAFAPGKER
ncbi:MAG TPA: zinc-binding dehydrogenase [Acidimicrobiales bacterium]|nr:zinc-binding dehydrogenase [Acidimicrobiales bacterium]